MFSFITSSLATRCLALVRNLPTVRMFIDPFRISSWIVFVLFKSLIGRWFSDMAKIGVHFCFPLDGYLSVSFVNTVA